MDIRVRKVIELLHAESHRRIEIEELAGAVNLSPSRLRHLFKYETGVSPGRYLRDLRMRKAKTLLGNTFMRVKEIVHAVGANDESHFMRDYKNIYGVTPSQYREIAHASAAAEAADDAREQNPPVDSRFG